MKLMENTQHGCQIKEFQGENIDDLATDELFEHLQQTGLVLLRGYSMDLEDLETLTVWNLHSGFHLISLRGSNNNALFTKHIGTKIDGRVNLIFLTSKSCKYFLQITHRFRLASMLTP
jgi:hypothetical protein